MEKLRIVPKMIIYVGPACGSDDLVKNYPNRIIDQNTIMRIIDASYFKTKRALKDADVEELAKYENLMRDKFVKEALGFLRKDFCLVLNRLDKDMFPKFFAFIPNGKLHAVVYRDSPSDIIEYNKENMDEKAFISTENVQKDFERIKSFSLAERFVWLPKGTTVSDVVDVSGAFDHSGKDQNSKTVKEVEEKEREASIINKAREVEDGVEE